MAKLVIINAVLERSGSSDTYPVSQCGDWEAGTLNAFIQGLLGKAVEGFWTRQGYSAQHNEPLTLARVECTVLDNELPSANQATDTLRGDRYMAELERLTSALADVRSKAKEHNNLAGASLWCRLQDQEQKLLKAIEDLEP